MEIRQKMFEAYFRGSRLLLVEIPKDWKRPFVFTQKSLLLVCRKFYQECLPIYHQQVSLLADRQLFQIIKPRSSTGAAHLRHVELIGGEDGREPYWRLLDKLSHFPKLQRVTYR